MSEWKPRPGLVLSRNIGERIAIGKDIVITIVNIDYARGKVRIGLEAPRDVNILRQELMEKPNES